MSDIKEYFVSRWGEDGVIMNADFSQLEVIVLAHLSKDPQLKQDILDGTDMHSVRAAQLLGMPYTKFKKKVDDGDPHAIKMRKLAKAFSFQLQYGSGAKNMAETNGVDINVAKKFISDYYDRYSVLADWQEAYAEEVAENSERSSKHSKNGYPVRVAQVQSETGRLYTYKQGDAPEYMVKKGTYTTFKPTELKNYPVQGTATGDIVPMMLGEVWRWLICSKYAEDAKLINTVHDSIMLDVKKSVMHPVGKQVKAIMESAPREYRNRFNVEFTLPLKVDIEVGPTWANQTKLEI